MIPPTRKGRNGSVATDDNKLITIELSEQAATENLARHLAGLARSGDIFALKGDLGAGKTVFARAFIRSLAGDDTEVPSPTFTLVQVYESNIAPLYHFDLYRLKHAEEAFELGLDEAFAGGICLIEWPERLDSLLPPDCLTLTITYGEGEHRRSVEIAAPETWLERLREADIGT